MRPHATLLNLIGTATIAFFGAASAEELNITTTTQEPVPSIESPATPTAVTPPPVVTTPAAMPAPAAASVPIAPIERPARGLTMENVEAKFGTPAQKHNAVGNPPITRWEYPGFVVYFENQHVLHTVVANAVTG